MQTVHPGRRWEAVTAEWYPSVHSEVHSRQHLLGELYEGRLMSPEAAAAMSDYPIPPETRLFCQSETTR